ncbi:MAG TPA: hypothetical protein VE029_07645 [Rhizobacter sp.]|nr:hypothetical protein [Rhizobacter sp.]
MHNAPQRLSPRYPVPQISDTIEWEELPSLAGQTVRGAANQGAAAWSVTLPATLDTLEQSTPFREPMRGLVMREVNEPDVFRHFFG